MKHFQIKLHKSRTDLYFLFSLVFIPENVRAAMSWTWMTCNYCKITLTFVIVNCTNALHTPGQTWSKAFSRDPVIAGLHQKVSQQSLKTICKKK